jgi:hypothetical protein
MAINFVVIGSLVGSIISSEADVRINPMYISLIRELSRGSFGAKAALLTIKKMTSNLIKREFFQALDLLEEMTDQKFNEGKIRRIIDLFQLSYQGFDGLPLLKEFEAESAAYAGILLAMLGDKKPAEKWLNRAIQSYTVIAESSYSRSQEWYGVKQRSLEKDTETLKELKSKKKLSFVDYVRGMEATSRLNAVKGSSQSLGKTITQVFDMYGHIFSGRPFRELFAKPEEIDLTKGSWLDNTLASAHWIYANATDSLTPKELEEKNRKMVEEKMAEAASAIVELASIKTVLNNA